MNDFLLTLPFCWVYARCAIAKSMDRFDSLNYERIWPLCGFFYVRKSLRLCFSGRKRGEPKGSPVLVTGLSTCVFPPARVSHGWRFSRNRSNKGA